MSYSTSKSEPTTAKGFFDLPAEIRIQIMSYALVSGKVRPGEIDPNRSCPVKTKILGFPCGLKALRTFNNIHTLRELSNSTPYSHDSTVGLLATCRQAYHEGHRTFYELNTFQLPHGPLKHTLQYFQGLTHEHRAMIRRVTIDLDSSDFTPEVLLKVEQKVMLPSMHPGMYNAPSYVFATRYAVEIWREKIVSCRDLGEIRQVGVRPFPLPKRTWHDLQDLRILLPPSEIAMSNALGRFVSRHGWELTKLWIQSGAYKQMNNYPASSYPQSQAFDAVIWNNGEYKTLYQIQHQKQQDVLNLKL
ncbi:MAG: hypothetical protein Q9167_007358, partial [Letrouitia subvulpina]